MAALATERTSSSGLEATLNAATAGGDTVTHSPDTVLFVSNGSGAQITVTITTHRNTDGIALPDKTVDIPAGESRFIGPFDANVYRSPDGNIDIGYSAATSVTVAAIKIPRR